MKKILFVLFSIGLVFWLATCSQDSNSGASENSGEESGDENVTLRIAWWGEQNRTDYTLKVIEMFEEEHPGVTIEPEYAGWDDYWRKLAPQAAANQLPDIIQMDLSYLSQYSKNNQITDLTPYIGEQINVDNISDNAVAGGEINGGVYGFNLGSTATSYFYNPAILEEIGVDSIPEKWSWEEYKEIAIKAGEAGYSASGGVTESQVLFDYYLRSQDKKLFAADGSGLGYDDDQLFIDYFSLEKQLVDAGAAPTPDEVAQRTGPEDDPLAKGEALGGVGWATQFPSVQQIAQEPLDIHSPPASSEGNTGLYLKPSMFFSVSENSEHKEIAAEFINFFVNNVEANKLILADRGIPVSSEIKEALKEEVPEEKAKVFDYIEWVEQNSQPMGGPDPDVASEVIEALQGIAEQIVYGQTSVEEGAAKFREEAESIFGK
ncbi:ABC transporter substrate-binding protein [Gracilibacillus salinarum]|uniref:Extracellular solute-binding protein n=1 Tax=Gracilibacillus salinarum TaxID=2932255 RepID=A0ABY4GNF4_9BACI|nr:extracellular solute-binding protein [Gracilibacillus salinarum]UOQ85262.1 extracellular solute-binding protein [Gracilibacillus salinarum]